MNEGEIQLKTILFITNSLGLGGSEKAMTEMINRMDMEKYDITHAILYNDELTALYMADDEDWNCMYKDDTFCIYEKVNK